jgi:hypothetical protein
MDSFERAARKALHGSADHEGFQGPAAREHYHEIAANARDAVLLLLRVLPGLSPIDIHFAPETIYEAIEALIDDRNHPREQDDPSDSLLASGLPAARTLATIDHDAAKARSDLAGALSDMIQVSKALAATRGYRDPALLQKLSKCLDAMRDLPAKLTRLASDRTDALAELADGPASPGSHERPMPSRTVFNDNGPTTGMTSR